MARAQTRSVFYHLLDAWKEGAAEGRELTLDDLVYQTRKRTEAFARNSLEAVQTPELLGKSAGTWILRPGRASMLGTGSKPGQEWTANGLKMAFCWCPRGKFQMGSPKSEAERSDEEELKEVALEGFWMGKHEVTQSEWERVMGRSLADQAKLATTRPDVKRDNTEGPRIPVYFVNRAECMEFAEKLTRLERDAGRLPKTWQYCLPGSAHWEYACRAGTTTRYVSGDTNRGLDEYAWSARNSGNVPHEVGTRKANAWGIHDMHGNIAEWCGPDPAERRRPGPVYELTDEVSRGGGYNATTKGLRSAHRGAAGPQNRYPMMGFRVIAAPVE